MKYALALGGGGARGAFEAGVWSALRDMNKEVEAITGTSVGAINGAAFISGVDAERLWQEIAAEDIIPGISDENILSPASLASNAGKIMKGGFDTEPLKRLLRGYISERRVRESGMVYGLCTYSATKRKPVEIFCENIPNGELIDYITASACMPVFKPVKIRQEQYIDGGIFNNIPENMLIKRGYTTVISVSVNAPGIVQPIDGRGVNIIDIKFNEPEQGIMEFKESSSKRSITQGYLECMRVFGKCSGKKYYINNKSYGRAVSFYGADIIEDIETAAEIAGVDRLREYTFTELVRAVKTVYPQCERLKNEVERIDNSASPIIYNELRGRVFRAANAIAYLMKN